MVRTTKLANPNALVIGYSNGASAVSDWRSNCVDLESIAKEGYMDAFIDQTWAGAWNEVGIRDNTFWNAPTLGWTYQLAYMLVHSAILADTHVRHYHLVETFDAWESWDVIHTAPEKLKWGIWAYSHATVKTPVGLKIPDGAYISWGNQGKRLLSEKDVAFLTRSLNAAEKDANQMQNVYGPTLVYNRDAMVWEMAHAEPDRGIKEWIDEQMGAVMKWPIPIMSITRLEWLSKVKSPLFIVQTPVHLSAQNENEIISLIHAGKPMLLLGSAVDGIDPKLAKLAGIEALSKNKVAYKTKASITEQLDGITKKLPTDFPTYQWWSNNKVIGGTQSVYSVDGSPVLTLNLMEGRHVAFWDPPEFVLQKNVSLLQQLGGSVAPYVLVARVVNSFLANAQALHASNIDPKQAIAVESWELKNGEREILAGNLEEGLREDADFTRHTTLVLPWENVTLNYSGVFQSADSWLDGKRFHIILRQAQAGLFIFSPISEK